MNFKNWILEYQLNPDFEKIELKKSSLRQSTKALQVDPSKYELIPLVLSKEAISLLSTINEKSPRFADAWNVINRLKEQGENVVGSKEMLIVYVSNLEAQNLRELAKELSNSDLAGVGSQLILSLDRGNKIASLHKLK